MFRDPSVKRCPRCNEKVLVHQKKCPFCGLVFERLKYVSNKSARKEVIKLHRKNYLMVKEWPEDASKKKALLLCGFLGFAGAHNFYLGRYYKAMIVLFGLLSALALVFIEYNSLAHKILYYISAIPSLCVLFFWVVDFIKIFLERYKIPVSIDKNLYKIKEEILENKD